MKTNTKKYLKVLSSALLLCIFISWDYSDVEYTGRWVNTISGKFYDSDFYIDLSINENVGLKNSSFPDEIITAGNTWSNVAGSYLNFNIVSGGTGRVNINEDNFINVAHFNQIGFDTTDPTNNNEYYVFKKESPQMAIAFRYLLAGAYDFNNWWDPRIRGCDILISPWHSFAVLSPVDCGQFDGKYYDFQSLVVHELGHMAGLRHPLNNSTKPTMYGKQYRGDCERKTLYDLDVWAIEHLYGSNNSGTTSDIPNNKFAKGDQTCDEGFCCKGCKDNCCDRQTCKKIGAQQTKISESAISNMATFREQKLRNDKNADALEEAIIDDQDELIYMGLSSEPQFKEIQEAAHLTLVASAPVVDATFDCSDYYAAATSANPSNGTVAYKAATTKDLRLKKENIEPFERLVTLVMAHTKNMKLKKELQKLKKFIPQMEGKTVVEAAIAYDNYVE